MKKTTTLLALCAMFAASSLLAKGNTHTGPGCGGSGGSVPDVASTMALMTVAVGSLGACRRFFRR